MTIGKCSARKAEMSEKHNCESCHWQAVSFLYTSTPHCYVLRLSVLLNICCQWLQCNIYCFLAMFGITKNRNCFLSHPVKTAPVLDAALGFSCSTRCPLPRKHQLQLSPPPRLGGSLGSPQSKWIISLMIKMAKQTTIIFSISDYQSLIKFTYLNETMHTAMNCLPLSMQYACLSLGINQRCAILQYQQNCVSWQTHSFWLLLIWLVSASDDGEENNSDDDNDYQTTCTYFTVTTK